MSEYERRLFCCYCNAQISGACDFTGICLQERKQEKKLRTVHVRLQQRDIRLESLKNACHQRSSLQQFDVKIDCYGQAAVIIVKLNEREEASSE